MAVKEIIAVINQKGGVGKSTTALALGQGLALRRNKVLFIDLDAQGNLSFTLNCCDKEVSVADVILKTAKIEDAIIQTKDNCDILPASPRLVGADAMATEVGKEYRLKESIDKIKNNYDYIIIDTPPALGILTVNALVACTGVIIPAQADVYSLQGISQLNSTIKTVKQYCNPSLEIKGILLTRFSNRTILSRDMLDMISQLANNMNTKLYNTKIRECIALKESQASRQNIFNYAPASNASVDYNNLLNEIFNINI